MQSGAQCALTLFWWQVVLEVLGFGSALVSTPRSHQVWKHLQTHRRHLQMPREEEAAASNLTVLAHLGFGQSSALVCNLATLARLGCGSTCWCLLWTHLQTQRRRQRTQQRQLHTPYRLACVVHLFDLAILRGQLWPNLACANLARANLARGCLGCNFANFVHDSSTWRWVRGEACKKWKSMQILGTTAQKIIAQTRGANSVAVVWVGAH